MPSTRRWSVTSVALLTLSAVSSVSSGACVHDLPPVASGALIGAVSGAALGAGTGVLISDDDLLGSSPESKMQLAAGPAIGAGTLIGAVFGAVIGAMVGHRVEQRLPSGHAQVTDSYLGKEQL